MIRQYWDIAKAACQHEKSQAAARINIEQKDFLPAALEVLEQPASPLGRFIVWFLSAFFVIALMWAVIGEIDVVAVAQGKLVPVGQTKVVQSFETGVVKELHVSNGSVVQTGQLLFSLDPTSNDASIEQLLREYRTQALAKSRLQWLLNAIKPQAANKKRVFTIDLSAGDRLIQESFAKAQIAEYRANKGSYNEQMAEQRAAIQVSKQQMLKIEQTLPLVIEQAEKLKLLSEEGISSRFEYLRYQEDSISRKNDLIIEQNNIVRIEANIRSLQQQQERYVQEFTVSIIGQLAQASDALVAIEQELIKVRQTNTLHHVKAPVTGVVQQLAIHTIGGVVRSGDAVMAIVPESRVLQLEANILNKDIGFVFEGQVVEIKIDAFPFTKYGFIHGSIVSIDHDAIADENLGLVYPARIKMDADVMTVNERDIRLSPGMSSVAEIKIGKRRIVEFVLAPLFRYKQESLRER